MVGMLCSPRRMSTMPSTISSLDVLARDSQARLVLDLARRDVADQTGMPRFDVTIVLRMSSIEWIRPTPRTTAACGPMLTVWPPTLTLLLLSACSTCASDRPYCRAGADRR